MNADGIIGWPGECSRGGGGFVDLTGAKNAPAGPTEFHFHGASTTPEQVAAFKRIFESAWTPEKVEAFRRFGTAWLARRILPNGAVI